MPGILADSAISKAIEEGTIQVSPYNHAHLNPGSLDLTLGTEVAVYEDWVHCYERSRASQFGKADPVTYEDGAYFEPRPDGVIDVKVEPRVRKFPIDPEKGWILKPGIGYLMHTAERVYSSRYIPVIDGKSSIGRLFVQVHATAGYGEVGFDGQYTLEVIVQKAVRVYPGMRFCQIRFHTTEGDVVQDYQARKSNYTGVNAVGAVPSRVFRQFEPPPVLARRFGHVREEVLDRPGVRVERA